LFLAHAKAKSASACPWLSLALVSAQSSLGVALAPALLAALQQVREQQVRKQQVTQQQRTACGRHIPNLAALSDLLHEGRKVLERAPVRVAAHQSKRDS
jgi:hypothetical protein